jgi:hypothetical protein
VIAVIAVIAGIAVNSTPLSSGTLGQFSAFWFSQNQDRGGFFLHTV